MSVTQPPDDMPGLLRAAAVPPGRAGPDCLDEETIAAVAEGQLEPAARNMATRHLASCAHCRAAVVSVVRALNDSRVAREIAPIERDERRSLTRFVLPIVAAAALAILFVRPSGTGDIETTHRAPTLTSASAPRPLSPIADVAEARVLRWSSVPGADRYRVSLFNARGQSLYEAQLTDTAATLPDSIALVAGESYLWSVDARIGWDRWSSSALTRFSLVAVPRR